MLVRPYLLRLQQTRYGSMDTRNPEQRRRIMQAVNTKNTGPELAVRRLLHGLGYRFRLHRKDLPGKPDIVLPRYRTAIFVHGCFWHAHGCSKGLPPRSNLHYWLPKLDQNVDRDKRKIEQLRSLGWRVEVIWQCELMEIGALATRLDTLLREASPVSAPGTISAIIKGESRTATTQKQYETNRN